MALATVNPLPSISRREVTRAAKGHRRAPRVLQVYQVGYLSLVNIHPHTTWPPGRLHLYPPPDFILHDKMNSQFVLHPISSHELTTDQCFYSESQTPAKRKP